MRNILVRIWNYFYAVVRLLILLPLNYILNKVLPYHDDRDGLAPAVTAKSAQQCISYLQSLVVPSPNTNHNNHNHSYMTERISAAWCNLGFLALKHEAQTTQSILLIYLHAPLHSDTKEFCSTTLNSDAFISYIEQDRILAVAYSIHTAQGLQLQNILHITTFPAIVVLQPSSSGTTSSSSSSSALQLVIKAQGKKQCYMTSIMPYLHAVYQRHLIAVNEVEVRRIQRQQEQELRQQQDMEYQATLAADQERERLLAEERNAILVAAAAQQEKERSIQQQEEDELQAAKQLLRPEPEANSNTTIPTTMIRFVLPSGIKMNRRFYGDETIASLRAYLHVYFVEQQSTGNTQQQQSRITNIGLSTNFPRQTFNDMEMDSKKTLMELGLVPQAVLMVQDLDA